MRRTGRRVIPVHQNLVRSSMSLTQGPVRQRLFELWWPMIFGIVAVKAIDLSDAWFVGQLGDTPLAAISFTFPIVLTLISLSLGLSAGASSVLSRAIGASASDSECRAVSTAAVLLSLAGAGTLTAAGFLLLDPVLKGVGARGETLTLARSFMQIWLLGTPFLILPIVVGGLLRAAGDGLTPAVIMGLIAVLNIAMNPLFIYGLGPVPAYGMDGAAIATLIARAIATALALSILKRRGMLSFSLAGAAESVRHWRAITAIGLPASLSTAINPMAISVATAAVATLGDDAVAAFGVATKIEEFALVPLLALSSAIAPLAGQNSGASETRRTRRALLWCAAVSAGWSMIVGIALWFAAPLLVSQFSESADVREAATTYLWIVPVSFVGYGCVISLSAALNALGRPLAALSLTAIRALGMLAPAAWLAVAFGSGFTGVATGVALANVLSGAIAFSIIRYHSLTVADTEEDNSAQRAAT